MSILQLARELDSLIKAHPRFRTKLYKLQAYVRNQLQPPENKEAAVVSCLRDSGWPLLDRDELVSDTNFDDESVRTSLAALMLAGKVEEVNREGNTPSRTRGGRPTDHVYYRLAKRRAAVPSPALSRRR